MKLHHTSECDNTVCYLCGTTFWSYTVGENNCINCNSYEVGAYSEIESHECDDPKCRGNILHQKLELFDEMNECLIDAYEELISIVRLQDWHSVEFRDKVIRMTEVLEKVNGKKIEEVLK